MMKRGTETVMGISISLQMDAAEAVAAAAAAIGDADAVAASMREKSWARMVTMAEFLNTQLGKNAAVVVDSIDDGESRLSKSHLGSWDAWILLYLQQY